MLSKGIPEIGASSLTTIGGLVAMMFMQFKIGPDMAVCLIKAVLCALRAELDTYEEVDYSMGLSNVEAKAGFMLADKRNPRQFAELSGLDYELAQAIYAAYGVQQEELGKVIGGITTYKVPLIDMMLLLCDQVDSGIVTLEENQMDMLKDAQTKMESAKKQLQGSEINRALIYLNLTEGGDETYVFLDTIRSVAQRYYPGGAVYVVGDFTVEQDFKLSFATDNLVITIASILIVLVVLLFTFQSAAMPLLLILVIQGAIWINFSVLALRGKPLFFMSCLVVSAIQMGANIDYAIVIASRYQEQKNLMNHEDAIPVCWSAGTFSYPPMVWKATAFAFYPWRKKPAYIF